jgi:hypothetical protein
MKLKNIILSALAAMSISACTTFKTEVVPSLELSYIPYVKYEREYSPVMYLNMGLEGRLVNPDFTLYLGGNSSTYSEVGKIPLPYLDPFSQRYDVFCGILVGDFDFFISHYCQHPIDRLGVPAWSKSGYGVWTNEFSGDRIGIKFSTKLK